MPACLAEAGLKLVLLNKTIKRVRDKKSSQHMTLLLISKACIPLGDHDFEVQSNFSLALDCIWLN